MFTLPHAPEYLVTFLSSSTLQAISKMQITFKDKARADEKAQHTR
jgi:hypothetical protein